MEMVGERKKVASLLNRAVYPRNKSTCGERREVKMENLKWLLEMIALIGDFANSCFFSFYVFI